MVRFLFVLLSRPAESEELLSGINARLYRSLSQWLRVDKYYKSIQIVDNFTASGTEKSTSIYKSAKMFLINLMNILKQQSVEHKFKSLEIIKIRRVCGEHIIQEYAQAFVFLTFAVNAI